MAPTLDEWRRSESHDKEMQDFRTRQPSVADLIKTSPIHQLGIVSPQMTETLDLRMTAAVGELFNPHEVSVLFGLYQIKLTSKDPRLPKIADLEQRSLESSRRCVVLSWGVVRRYSATELRNAEAFKVIWPNRFRPTGEECGTGYDCTPACAYCGSGRVQTSDLTLDLRKLPRHFGIAASLGGEIIVSQQVAELIVAHEITGFSLKQVRHRASQFTGPLNLERVPSGQKLLLLAEEMAILKESREFYVWINREDGEAKTLFEQAMTEAGLARNSSRTSLPVCYQIVPEGTKLEVSERTSFGISPFNPDRAGDYRCPHGHSLGLNVISEVSIKRSSWDNQDLAVTRQLAGHHPDGSLLYPEPLLIVSPRLRNLLIEHKIRGVRTEIAYLRDQPHF